MTEAVWIQLITSVATIVTLIITHFLQKRATVSVAAEQTATIARATDVQTATIERSQAMIAGEVQQVHELANDRLTKALDAKTELERTVITLEAELRRARGDVV
jgi:hypothetical protein